MRNRLRTPPLDNRAGPPEEPHQARHLVAEATLLRTNGVIELLGAPDKPAVLPATTADVETSLVQGINEAYERRLKGEVPYRFVIHAASLG